MQASHYQATPSPHKLYVHIQLICMNTFHFVGKVMPCFYITRKMLYVSHTHTHTANKQVNHSGLKYFFYYCFIKKRHFNVFLRNHGNTWWGLVRNTDYKHNFIIYKKAPLVTLKALYEVSHWLWKSQFAPPAPITLFDSPVDTVKFFHLLGTIISQDLKWEPNISFLTKKAQQRMYILQQLKKFNLPETMMVHFCTAIIESILTSSITIWYAAATGKDKGMLQRIIRTAEMIGHPSRTCTPPGPWSVQVSNVRWNTAYRIFFHKAVKTNTKWKVELL